MMGIEMAVRCRLVNEFLSSADSNSGVAGNSPNTVPRDTDWRFGVYNYLD